MVKIFDAGNENHKASIKSWFDAISADGGIERFDHLHIDSIDGSWKPVNTWIPAALESFKLALEVRDESGHVASLVILLAIDLQGGEHLLGMTFHDRVELERSLSYTPPSLYLLRRGQEFWKRSEDGVGNETKTSPVTKLGASALFGSLEGDWECFYTESKKADDDEYSRSLYLAG